MSDDHIPAPRFAAQSLRGAAKRILTHTIPGSQKIGDDPT